MSGETAGLPGAVIVSAPGKDFGRVASSARTGRNSVVEFFWSGQARQNKAASGREAGTFTMTFTGTMIEDLIASVERAEAKTQALEMTEIEPWFASAQENANNDSKLLRLA